MKIYESPDGGKTYTSRPMHIPAETEISDEEIREQAIKYDNGAFSETPIVHFMEGAIWYREQLKTKNNVTPLTPRNL